MPLSADPFQASKNHIKFASAEILQLAERCNAAINECKFEVIRDDQSHPTEIIYKVRIQGLMPDILERDAERLIGELRSALDKATNAASKLIGTNEPKYTHFPFGDTEAQLRNQLASGRGPFRGIPVELHAFLLGLGPYEGPPGGNGLLRNFGHASNPSKHENLLFIDIHLDGVTFNDTGIFSFAKIGNVWNEVKNECEVFRICKDRTSNGKVGILTPISFNDASALSGEEFAPTMSKLAGIVNRIVLGLEAETERILRARS